MTMIWLVISMSAMLGIGSFAVDFAIVQMSKTQLQTATDAAARAAVVGLQTSATAARNAAKSVALANPINGAGLVLTDADILVGRWTPGTGTFVNNGSPANAVRISAQLSAARNTAVPLIFAKTMGRQFCNVTARSTATIAAAINTTTVIAADSNPWLAGMPNGTKANAGSPGAVDDQAPAQSPPAMTGITLSTGQVLTFDGISGTGSNSPGNPNTGPDGNSSWVGTNWAGTENGMASLKAPMNSLVGVFLSNSAPTANGQGSTPSMLDFTTSNSRNFTSLSPALRQPFFIGDGRTSTSGVQQFVVPAGATRLFLCSMDEYEWNNNSGSRTVQINKPQIISLVD